MLFNSIDYMIFFPVIFLGYYIFPKKYRYLWLLFASYYFYMNWNPWYVFLLLGCTFLTYISAILIERQDRALKKTRILRKSILGICIFFLLGILGYFKYSTFFLFRLNQLLVYFHFKEIQQTFNVLLPVGISFYILQSIGYMIDVYRGEVYAERNFFRYALFVSFFPQLVAGPIERSKNLLSQLANPSKITWYAFREGLLMILYGLFCKIVIADRIAIIVNTVYNNPANYPGLYIAYAAILFSFQIYCDFYGYSTIAKGSAQLLGIKLMDNFNAPYFAQSIKDFWRRWHISLSSWFRDYLYIPLGGNRKGQCKKELNLLIVFGISGLWHGASFSFIFWGLLNGLYQIIDDIFKMINCKIRKVLKIEASLVNEKKDKNFSKRILNTFGSFILITLTWIFFSAGGLHNAFHLLAQMLSIFNWTVLFDGSLYSLGVSKGYTAVMFVSIGLLILVDYYKYKGISITNAILKQGLWFRIFVFVILTLSLMIFGCYGEMYDTQEFIYFQF